MKIYLFRNLFEICLERIPLKKHKSPEMNEIIRTNQSFNNSNSIIEININKNIILFFAKFPPIVYNKSIVRPKNSYFKFNNNNSYFEMNVNFNTLLSRKMCFFFRICFSLWFQTKEGNYTLPAQWDGNLFWPRYSTKSRMVAKIATRRREKDT